MADPRVYFAAERTLLAWIRSCLTVIMLGFVIERFGLFLAFVSTSAGLPVGGPYHHWPSSALGITTVILGAGSILGALQNFRMQVRSLPAEDVPPAVVPWLTTFLAAVAAAVGMLLAVYLVLT